MEPNPVSEELPALYRAILDRVAEISAGGQRHLANQVRAEAIAIYSRAWDDRARRDLDALLRRYRSDTADPQPARRGARRRTVRAA
jgi:hypothetical protein